jgi:hypothetical protein
MFFCVIDGFGEKGKPAHGDEGAVPPNAIQIGYEICFFFLPFFLSSSATNKLITAKDHASVQISIGHLDESGLYNCQYLTFALCGFTRAQVLIFYVL